MMMPKPARRRLLDPARFKNAGGATEPHLHAVRPAPDKPVCMRAGRVGKYFARIAEPAPPHTRQETTMKTNGQSPPFWLASASMPSFPPLPGPSEADVCVIGGGIAGLTTAYLLSQE